MELSGKFYMRLQIYSSVIILAGLTLYEAGLRDFHHQTSSLEVFRIVKQAPHPFLVWSPILSVNDQKLMQAQMTWFALLKADLYCKLSKSITLSYFSKYIEWYI